MPDGRVIEILTDGPADGLPLVLHEGTPVGLALFPPTVELAAVRGLRAILVARPGYEGSSPRLGRQVKDVAQDVAAVLDALGAETFITAGWSGGGPDAAWPPPPSRVSRPTARKAWTGRPGRPGWGQKTSRSSAPRVRGRPR
jgi:pimeloyl-ACP methyl ester carboxylesterase